MFYMKTYSGGNFILFIQRWYSTSLGMLPEVSGKQLFTGRAVWSVRSKESSEFQSTRRCHCRVQNVPRESTSNFCRLSFVSLLILLNFLWSSVKENAGVRALPPSWQALINYHIHRTGMPITYSQHLFKNKRSHISRKILLWLIIVYGINQRLITAQYIRFAFTKACVYHI